MKILVIGTGGTGGAIGGFLAADKHDVTFIARGKHMEAMKKNGFKLHTTLRGELVIPNPKVMEADDYKDTPDVIFICVKDYSLEVAQKLIKRAAALETIVIPILNVVNTGDRLRTALPSLTILDGCIYIVSWISAPGEVTQKGPRFRIHFGEADKSHSSRLAEIADMLKESGINAVVSQDIKRDCFQKLAMVSPMATAASYYNATASEFLARPEIMEDYLALTGEVIALAKAMGLEFTTDMIESNKTAILKSDPDATTSMHRDIMKGGDSELDGLVFEQVRLGKKYGVPTPIYEKIALHFGYKGN